VLWGGIGVSVVSLCQFFVVRSLVFVLFSCVDCWISVVRCSVGRWCFPWAWLGFCIGCLCYLSSLRPEWLFVCTFVGLLFGF